MRKANTGDMFKLVRIVDELKLTDEIYKMLDQIEQKGASVNVNKLGFDLIATLISKASSEEAENKIYDFLSKPFEKSVDEIKEMDYVEFGKGVSQVLDFKSIVSFFKSANRSA